MTDQSLAADSESSAGLRVVKLGGSLLGRAGWPDDFRRWLAAQPSARNILIVGGGSLVDVVRHWDELHKLSAEEAHWLAIAAMSVTAKLARVLLPEAFWTDSWPAVLEFSNSVDTLSRPLVFEPGEFLESIEPTLPGPGLPPCWDVTSDSIAARIAGLLPADELVLLKACPLDDSVSSLAAAAEAGYVDRAFPDFARGVRLVRFADL